MNGSNSKENITELRKEVGLLRSFIIGAAGRDKEGVYRPEFVRRILRAAGEEQGRIFSDAQSFLRKLRK